MTSSTMKYEHRYQFVVYIRISILAYVYNPFIIRTAGSQWKLICFFHLLRAQTDTPTNRSDPPSRLQFYPYS